MSSPEGASDVSEAAAEALVPCSFPRRLACMLYDGLLLVGVQFVGALPALMLTGGEAVPAGDPLFRLWLLTLTGAYFVYPWWRAGQTLGMLAWRVRLVAQDGSPPTLRQALLRYLAALLSLAVCGLGFLYALVDGEQRAWHDHVSGTRLLRSPRAPRRELRS